MNSSLFSTEEKNQIQDYLKQIQDNVALESMTPVERYRLTEEYKPTDRVPIRLASMEHNAANINASIKDILLNPNKAILAAMSTVATYKSDNIIPYGDSHLIGPPETGAKIEYPENSTAVYVDYPIKSHGDLKSLSIPDPSSDGNLPIIMETISETAELIGDQIFVMQNCLGPLGFAGDIRGPTQLLMDIVREPEFVHELMNFSTEACIAMAKAIQEAGARPLMWDAMGSPTYSGKKRYM
ncbi:MAG: hypothetical protein KAR20_23520, partial [Candidatus Heimdallarchaeota archaeon]|nr:hypothetical protein [Candidatus Heimdallarchaeota archaeon]